MLWRREKSCPYRESNPGRPARSPSLYRLSYPDSQQILIYLKLLVSFFALAKIIVLMTMKTKRGCGFRMNEHSSVTLSRNLMIPMGLPPEEEH
jgi:hypothetical protein